MLLKSLSIVNFKNYEEASFTFNPKVNCLIGNNGEGKTNVLDAIYYLSFCKSFFNPIDSQNIKHNEGFFVIQGAFALKEMETPQQLKEVGITERLGEQIDLNQTFTDHMGMERTLSHYTRGDVPLLLTLNYFSCDHICDRQLEELAKALKTFNWGKPGEKFRIVTISVDPNDDQESAMMKRMMMLKTVGRKDVEWHFLTTSNEANVKSLAQSLGYFYKYDPETAEYIHHAASFYLSPKGKISRYLYGLEYNVRDMRFAFIDATNGRIGTTLEKIFLSCFYYDHTQGKYGPYAFGIMRVGGSLTVLIIALWLSLQWRREKYSSV